ncbi:hypothetical protein ACFQAT_28380 [Undibacterium arcticum]|uniref:hypothetical protein n=1 Tax=Undibacterium arcticum TaxID=1762892 RepID=UPI003606E91F
MAIKVIVDDDGNISFRDSEGTLVSQTVIDAAKRQQGDKIKGLIQEKCDEINAQIDALAEIHLHTPRPVAPAIIPGRFSSEMPRAPVAKKAGFFFRLFKWYVARIERENLRIHDAHNAAMEEWEAQRTAFQVEQQGRERYIARVLAGEQEAVAQYFEESLQDIVWPRETEVDYDLHNDGTMFLNVDLPEIEDMPTKTASAPARGYRLTVKDMSATAVQKLYMRHIHSIGFRMIGEVFAVSPAIKTVICRRIPSGHQRQPVRLPTNIYIRYGLQELSGKTSISTTWLKSM